MRKVLSVRQRMPPRQERMNLRTKRQIDKVNLPTNMTKVGGYKKLNNVIGVGFTCIGTSKFKSIVYTDGTTYVSKDREILK